MDQNSKKTIDTYIKAVEKELKCSKMLTSVFRKKFLGEIYHYAEQVDTNGETITYENLSNRFGSPKGISDGFMSREDYTELLRKAKRKTILWRCVAVVGVALLIAAVILLIFVARDSGGKVTVTTTTSF